MNAQKENEEQKIENENLFWEKNCCWSKIVKKILN